MALTEIADFGLIVLAVSATVFVALLGMRIADRLSLPYAALFLVGAALLAEAFSSLQDVVSVREVERLTVVALVIILFDGGLHIGLRRFRRLRARSSPSACLEPSSPQGSSRWSATMSSASTGSSLASSAPRSRRRIPR